MTPVPRLTAFVLAVLLPVVTIAPALGPVGSVLRTALAGVVLVAVLRNPGRLAPHLAWLAFTWVALVGAMALGSPDLVQGISRAVNWLMFMPLLALAPHRGHWPIVVKSVFITCWVHILAVGAQLLGVLGGTWGGILTSGTDYDPEARNYLTRYTGLVFNPNDLGLVLSLGVMVALIVASHRPTRVWFAIPSAVVFTVGIVLTGSRGALTALVLGIAVLLVFLPTFHRLLVISFATIGAITLMTREGETRLVVDSIADILSGQDHSANVRRTLWSDYLNQADNLLLGGAFGATVRDTAAQSAPTPTHIATVDNSMLKLLLEGGGVSVLVFLALLAAVYLPLLARRSTRDRYAAGAILALAIMIAFRSLSVDLFDINPWNAIIWLFAGLAVGLGAQPPESDFGRHRASRWQRPDPRPRRTASGPDPAGVEEEASWLRNT